MREDDPCKGVFRPLPLLSFRAHFSDSECPSKIIRQIASEHAIGRETRIVHVTLFLRGEYSQRNNGTWGLFMYCLILSVFLPFVTPFIHLQRRVSNR